MTLGLYKIYISGCSYSNKIQQNEKRNSSSNKQGKLKYSIYSKFKISCLWNRSYEWFLFLIFFFFMFCFSFSLFLAFGIFSDYVYQGCQLKNTKKYVHGPPFIPFSSLLELIYKQPLITYFFTNIIPSLLLLFTTSLSSDT